jgi:2-polyprenyl-3-methyl-5-hydroxy-6-metoxy-1,4-benzoquinol methylase
MSNQELVESLRQNYTSARGWLNQFKIIYRPYICPFVELLEMIPPSKKVFDIGCGNGMFLLLTSLYKKPSRIGGVEISETLIENAIQLLGKEREGSPSLLKVYDGKKIPNEINDFDLVFLIDVLHHVPLAHHTDFIGEIYAKMKKGATLILKDIDAEKWMLTRFNKLHDLLLSGEIGHELSSKEAGLLLQSSGFTVQQTTYKRMVWYPHYTIVADKN